MGVLLHYLILVAMMWTAAEALLVFQKLVIVFTNISLKYLVMISLICWSEFILNRILRVSLLRGMFYYDQI